MIETYPSGSLLSLPGSETGVASGIAELGYGGRVVAGTLPLKDVLALPPLQGEFTAVQNMMTDWFFLRDYFRKDEEAMGIIDLAPINLHSLLFVTAKKPINNVEDIRGMTLISTNKWIIRLLSGLGATMLSISNLEGADALAKGMIDGGVWNVEGPMLFGWTDYFKPGYFSDAGSVARSGGGSNVYINKGVYDRLPKDLRETFEYLTWRWFSVYFAAYIDAGYHRSVQYLKERGVQFIVWSDDEKAKFTKVKAKIPDAWIAEMEKLYKRGAEAAEVFKVYSEATSKYVPPAHIAVPHQYALDEETRVKWKAEWDALLGPGSTWGMGYKAYPNQVGLRKLEGNEFRPWK